MRKYPLISALGLMLSGCSATAQPIPESSFVSSPEVLDAISDCLGFGDDWDAWLEKVQGHGWVKVSSHTFEFNGKGVRLASSHGTMQALLQEDPTGWIGKTGRCELGMAASNPEQAETIRDAVNTFATDRNPDWPGKPYISDTDNLVFALTPSQNAGDAVGLVATIGYSTLKIDPNILN